VRLSLEGQWPAPGNFPVITSVAVSGNYAFVTSATRGLDVLDVRNPASPQRVGGLASVKPLHCIAVSGNYAYVAEDSRTLWTLDISNPIQPQYLTNVALGGFADNLTVFGARLYAAYGDSVEVLDITDRAFPVSTTVWDGFPSDTHGLPAGAYELQAVGNLAYVAEGYLGMAVLDISNPAVRTEVARYAVQGGAFYAVTISGKYAYLPNTGFGLVIMDISDPTNAMVVGNVAMSNAAGPIAVAGQYVYVADQVLTIYQMAELPANVPTFTEFNRFGTSALALGWNEAARGMKLQQSSSLANPVWQDVPGSTLTNQALMPVIHGSGAGFFRLVKP